MESSNPAETMIFFPCNYQFLDTSYVACILYIQVIFNLNQEEKLLGNKVSDYLKKLNGVKLDSQKLLLFQALEILLEN
jgi:hypothetical protein